MSVEEEHAYTNCKWNWNINKYLFHRGFEDCNRSKIKKEEDVRKEWWGCLLIHVNNDTSKTDSSQLKINLRELIITWRVEKKIAHILIILPNIASIKYVFYKHKLIGRQKLKLEKNQKEGCQHIFYHLGLLKYECVKQRTANFYGEWEYCG